LLWLVRQRDIVTPLLYLTLALAVIWSLDGLLQFFTGSNILGYPYNGRRVAGLFYPDLSLGIVLAQMLPLVLEASRRLCQRTRAAAVLPVIVASVVVLSGSRSAILTMLIAVSLYGVFLWWFYRPSKAVIAGAVAALLIGFSTILWISPETRDRISAVAQLAEMNVEGVDAATSKRGRIWVAAWAVATDEPLLGVGVRGFEPIARERGYIDRGFSHVHLYGLDVLVATGVVGLGAYLIALTGILGALWRRAIIDPALSPGYAVAGLTVLGALKPINAHWTIYSSYSLSVAWLMIGISLALIMRRGG